MRYLLPLCSLLLPLSTFATTQNSSDKQWFNTAEYNHVEQNSVDSMVLSTSYYFAPQQNTGVWDDFGYLDTDSKISASYTDSDFDNYFSLSGEAFYNNWFVNAEVQNLGEEDNHAIGFGYLYNDALKVSITQYVREDNSDPLWLQAQYNHQINESDYLGVTVSAQDNLDNWSVSTRYFRKLDDGAFFTLDASHADGEHSSSVTAFMASYYFNTNFAVGAGLNDSDLQLEAKYFLSDKYFYRAYYSDSDQGDLISASFNAYF
ncbi:putative porin [Pseudoalteromonas byunsanensis]|uniref:Putative porin n=1 Tax=Pseudoalteromonas byunsanensis TaxID=327939 RepID=A0A1S1N2A6_9GAMM|nr:putative porin [Pseudoalteromonas byunsanensis]OHU93520.1 putative porin [Pseudoalteromonas byunsanensis]